MITDVTTYYLEMTDSSALRPKRIVHRGLDIKQAHVPSPEFNRFFYTAVGGDWYWMDRLPWTYQQWRDWVARPAIQTWVACVSGTPAVTSNSKRKPTATWKLPSSVCCRNLLAKGWEAIC
jgi:hypothetical protein